MVGVRSLPFLLGLCAACTSTGEVRLVGQFTPEVPPPSEIRVMLDPHYGHSNCAKDDHVSEHDEQISGPAFVSVRPDPSGYFESDAFPVLFTNKQWSQPAEPTFFISFENERDVIYAAGQRHSVFQYRTFDSGTKKESPREENCWKVVRGTFRDSPSKGRELMLFLGPNYDSPKHCLPEGNFTPGSFGPYKPHED